ncbi:hypothetical protein DRE_07700 [Drechslerella stenobrocha 248]|uniref:Protein kinase domain-containing protein n=1 Tax=Drechslerella stenobrocha 248 TaxID=1043628 RepID=W7HHQ2_9PEZI|nr:hypothetical protein DRE_07700 [Drechslerella stenobrocha 248]
MVHRDIKAANILVDQHGAVKIADFGVSARLGDYSSLCTTFVGTPLWMAPEIIETHIQKKNGYNEKVDIWSLAITAIELAQGEPPYANSSAGQALLTIPSTEPPTVTDDFSQTFRDFLSFSLVINPDYRPSAKQVLDHKFINQALPTHKLRDIVLRRTRYCEEQGKRGLPFMAGAIGPKRPVDFMTVTEASSRRNSWDINTCAEWSFTGTADQIKLLEKESTNGRPAEGGRERPSPGIRISHGPGYLKEQQEFGVVMSRPAPVSATECEAVQVDLNTGRRRSIVHPPSQADYRKRASISEAVPRRGRLSLEPRALERPRTAVAPEARRGSAANIRDRPPSSGGRGSAQATPKASGFGRPLASAEVNARVAGHKPGRDSEAKSKVGSGDKSRAEDAFRPEPNSTIRQRDFGCSQSDRLSSAGNGGPRKSTAFSATGAHAGKGSGQDTDPFLSGFRTAAPHDIKGRLGRMAFDSIVKLAMEELYVTLAPGRKKDVLKNLAKAWAELDALSPELELTLIRKMCRGVKTQRDLDFVVFGEPKVLDNRGPTESRLSQLSKMDDVVSQQGDRERGPDFTVHPDLKREEQLARDRRMEYLDRHDAEPLFATTRNEQLKNQHWNKANRSRVRLTAEQLSRLDNEQARPASENESIKTAATVPKAADEDEAVWSDVSVYREEPSQDNNQREREESPPFISPVLRRRPAQQNLDAGSDSEGEQEKKVHIRPASIDRTPQTPKIERKRRPAARTSQQDSSAASSAAKAAPARAPLPAPSPLKLLSPRTRLRQALMSDDESSPPASKNPSPTKLQLHLADDGRTPLIQKRISQLRSPEENIGSAVASKQQAFGVGMGENIRRDVERTKNRLAFARRVEYVDTPPEKDAPTHVASAYGPLPIHSGNVNINISLNVRPRAQSTLNPLPPPAVSGALPPKTPGRKRSKSNLGSYDARDRNNRANGVDAVPNTHSANPPLRPESARSSSSRVRLTPTHESAPTDQFGPELRPARRLERPILRPISQPSGARPQSSRLGRQLTTSEPVLGSAAREREREREKEPRRFSRPTTERRRSDVYRREREEARDTGMRDPVYRTPPAKGTKVNF